MYSRTDIMEAYKKCYIDHIKRNDYHTQHHYRDMSEEARMELTCHILGQVMGRARKHGINITLADCRKIVEDRRWNEWYFAIADKLPPASTNEVPFIPHRWTFTKYPAEEREALIQNKDIFNLECVKGYINDLIKFKFAVYDVWREICEYDPRFKAIEERINGHNIDLFRTDTIIAYTLELSEFEEPK